jgi:hypothetical protein
MQTKAEDMEFSECRECAHDIYGYMPTCSFVVDVAAKEPDPHLRIAYVAAFGMSNYSSTIGRIAKPFNPMLVSGCHLPDAIKAHRPSQGETFEYVRLDKGYRYISEQVSHHPPISACWAESPSWHYYGEV